MPDRIRDKEALTEDELERQHGEELPEREAMAPLNANEAEPINAAVTPKARSDEAERDPGIDEST